jgi:hypothetical protein
MAFDPKAHLIQLPRRVKDPATGQWTTRLDDYLEVKWRLVWFRERYPHGTITTEALLLDWPQGIAVIKATVADGEGGQATGLGTETRKGFEDFVEKSETRAIGRALAALGIGTQFVGEELSEGDHIADAPVASTSGQGNHPAITENQGSDGQPDPDASPITQDQARELKKLAQTVFGYSAGEVRLRQDLGFEVDEKLTLRHLAAHVTVAQAAVTESYTAVLRQEFEAGVP